MFHVYSELGPSELGKDLFSDYFKGSGQVFVFAAGFGLDQRFELIHFRVNTDAKAHREKVIAEAEGETSRFLAVLKEGEGLG